MAIEGERKVVGECVRVFARVYVCVYVCGSAREGERSEGKHQQHR